MNRHIPNGMYGGVGGRGLVALSYPIISFLKREQYKKPERQETKEEKNG